MTASVLTDPMLSIPESADILREFCAGTSSPTSEDVVRCYHAATVIGGEVPQEIVSADDSDGPATIILSDGSKWIVSDQGMASTWTHVDPSGKASSRYTGTHASMRANLVATLIG